MQKQLAAHPELANDEVALQEVNAAFFKEYLPLLQKSEPTIKQPVRWKNALGELNANLDISIADPAKSSSSTNKDIKSLNFDVKLPLNVATEIAKQLNLSEGMDAEKAQKQADKQISGMMTLGQMFQLITIDNNTASLQLRYTPGKVAFNGQEMSEEEFMSRAGRFCSLKYSLASAHSEASKIYLSCRCDDINDVRSRSFSCHSEFSHC